MKKVNWFKTLIFTGIILGALSLIPSTFTSMLAFHTRGDFYGYDRFVSPLGYGQYEYINWPYIGQFELVFYYRLPAVLIIIGIILLASSIIGTFPPNTSVKRMTKRIDKTAYIGAICTAFGPVLFMIFSMHGLSLEDPTLPGFYIPNEMDVTPWNFFFGYHIEEGDPDDILVWYASGGFYMPIAGAVNALIGAPLLVKELRANYRPIKPPRSAPPGPYDGSFGNFEIQAP
ncbi:MAG: hypothetical protein ACFFCS_22810 [Candidatus Hodarchaeota archaeon]